MPGLGYGAEIVSSKDIRRAATCVVAAGLEDDKFLLYRARFGVIPRTVEAHEFFRDRTITVVFYSGDLKRAIFVQAVIPKVGDKILLYRLQYSLLRRAGRWEVDAGDDNESGFGLWAKIGRLVSSMEALPIHRLKMLPSSLPAYCIREED